MAVTLKDVALKAGVSISTVSRVINDDKVKPASKKTADKVWRIANEMGYVPNQTARSLIMGDTPDWEKVKTQSIGCVYTSTKDSFGDPFFSHIGKGIRNQLVEEGYELSFIMSIYEKGFEDLQKFLMKNPVDGIIVMGRFDQGTLEYLKIHCDRIIYAGVNAVDAGFDEVICDSYKGITELVQYIVDEGHTEIGFIGDTHKPGENYVVNEHRFAAYEDSMKKHGLILGEDYIIDTKPYPDKTYEVMKAYLTNRDLKTLPSAFVCSNDFSAIGAMKAFQEIGVRIPEDVSIAGFDNIDTGLYVNPPLTTVNVPKEELGRMAVKILVDKIKHDRVYPLRVDIPYNLVIRDSVCFK